MQNLLPGTESISEDPFGKGSTRLEGGFSRVLQVQMFLEGRQEERRKGGWALSTDFSVLIELFYPFSK